MPVWTTLLIALAITIGVCILLVYGPYFVVLAWMQFDKNIGLKDIDAPPMKLHPATMVAIFGFIFLLVFGVMLVPPEWRVRAALTAVSLVIGLYVLWIVHMNASFRS